MIISLLFSLFIVRHGSFSVQHSKSSDTKAYRYSLPSHPSDFDDYSSTYSGDDSGFSESSQFLRRPLVKHGTRVLPDLPSQEAASSNSRYHESLKTREGVSYYKTLGESRAVEGWLYKCGS